tara:strand:- start:326 stop:1399 length:1074 start_codon:yes stop_codon:yes gene_type:complete
MAYSTGSGDYVALMAAVLVHAVADGWTEDGGIGTGFPIVSPNGNTCYDWTSFTSVENDFTLGGAGGVRTQRYIRHGLGITGALATTNAASTTTVTPNMAYTFTEYHIFSDLTVSEHITVVVGFSNGVNPDVFTTFSFGELDKGGLTYGGVSYATGHEMQGYAETTNAGSSQNMTWNWALSFTRLGFCGVVGESGGTTSANHSFITQSTLAPHVNGTAGWPAWDLVHQNGAYVWNKQGIGTVQETYSQQRSASPAASRGIVNEVVFTSAPSQTGTVSMMPQPFFVINGTDISSSLMYLGVYPNSRLTSVEGVIAGQEITYGSEVWKIFPILRKTDWNIIQTSGIVTSGTAGIAIKKVV